MSSREPLLTIQVVGWNSARELPATLKALAAHSSSAVVIRYLDNGSNDDSVALVRELLPRADVVELEHNLGFAAAHNVGFRRCTTSYVMTHDPDLTSDAAGIRKLLAAFDDPSVGAVQGKLYRAANSVIDSAGIVLTAALNGKERGAGERDEHQFDVESHLIAVTGAAGIYRMQALADVMDGEDFFDEDFFAYKEDVDLGWRLSRAGWKVLYQPIYVGRHRRTLGRRGFLNWGMRPASIWKRLASVRTRYSLRNWVWMIVKNVSFWQALKAELFVDVRLFTFFVLSLLYPPLLGVWSEIIRGLPAMARKRNNL